MYKGEPTIALIEHLGERDRDTQRKIHIYRYLGRKSEIHREKRQRDIDTKGHRNKETKRQIYINTKRQIER